MVAMARMPGRYVRVICKTVFCKGAATWPARITDRGDLRFMGDGCKLWYEHKLDNLGLLDGQKVVVRDEGEVRLTRIILPDTQGL